MYWHIKVYDLKMNIHYIKCASWDIVLQEIKQASIRQITIVEVRDNRGMICPIY